MTIEERLERIEHAILTLAARASNADDELLAGRSSTYEVIHDTLHLDGVGYDKLCRKQRGEA